MDALAIYLLGVIHGGGPKAEDAMKRLSGRGMGPIPQDALLERKFSAKRGPGCNAFMDSIGVRILPDVGAVESAIQTMEKRDYEREQYTKSVAECFLRFERKVESYGQSQQSAAHRQTNP